MKKKKMNEILINSKKMLMATFANERDENNHRGWENEEFYHEYEMECNK